MQRPTTQGPTIQGAGRRAQAEAGGFSMIELLVVITILAALAAAGTIWFGMAERAKLKAITTSRLTAIATGLESLKLATGAYPSTDNESLRGPNREKIGAAIGTPNESNQGIETVYVAFHMTGVSISTDDLGDSAIANLDEDGAIETTGTSLTSNELFEYVDAWGNPFVYFNGKDYKDVSKVSAYVNYKLEDVTAAPMASEKTGAFLRAASFQLFSMGSDGQPNTEDDIAWGTK